jgi:hypothetical protein
MISISSSDVRNEVRGAIDNNSTFEHWGGHSTFVQVDKSGHNLQRHLPRIIAL